MTTQRETDETKATTDLSQSLRTQIADHLEKRAKTIEHASTERHVELLQNETEILHLVRSVADQHEAVVCRIAKEIKNPRSSIDEYRSFGKVFATTAVQRKISLRDAINGLLFLKSEMLHDLSEHGFLDDTTGLEVKVLMDFIGTRVDVLFAELAISFHANFTGRLEQELAVRQQQNLQKDLFIRIASHEIRNPLTSALSICELVALKGGATSSTEDKTHESFQVIHSNLLSINRHLNQLLDMSLLEDDKINLHMQSVNVPEILSCIKDSFERISNHRVATLKLSGPLQIETDPDRFEQIIMNLLQNAAKYSAPKSAIELALVGGTEQVTISVTDHGNGIPEQDLERIFDPYERLIEDKVKDISKDNGLGLGLYISRTLATALGGTLTVESTLGTGSTFTLTLPA
jgi:signal transduction histidine kinase